MCPDVGRDQAGDCPKCGMALERVKCATRPTRTIYTCPMHPDVEPEGPGTCPECGMELDSKFVTDVEEEDDSDLRSMTLRFWVAIALAAPVLLLAMLPMIGMTLGLAPVVSRWLQLALCTPVVLWAAWPFFLRGWRSVISWNLNMFTLISLGVAAAYLYSVVAMLVPGMIPDSFKEHGHVAVYFEAAAVIVALVLMGQVLELRARRRTSSAIKELLSLVPPTARVIRDGQEQEVALDGVRTGEILKVVPGEKVPLTGRSHRGRALWTSP